MVIESAITGSGRSNPSETAKKHLAVINDAAFSTMVGVVAEYNSACVNTLRRSRTVTNIPATREIWWPF